MIAKSWIYVPGDRPDRFMKAVSCGANAVLIDLEDAVFESNKDVARKNIVDWLANRVPNGVAIWVRVNAGDRGIEDAVAVATPGLTGICLPKARACAQISAVAELLSSAEVGLGLADGTFLITPLVESAAALLQIDGIASAPRVSQLQIGEVDLAADMGVELGDQGLELLYARSRVVLASAAAGILPPVGAVTPDFKDLGKLLNSTKSLRAMGFFGRACIHPSQIAIVNEVFTPTPDEVKRAQDVLDQLSTAALEGRGIALTSNGKMIDEASARWARRILGMTSSAVRGPNSEQSRR